MTAYLCRFLAVAWPFGCPARFTTTGGVQTRYAQTVPAFISGAGCTARPGHKAKEGCGNNESLFIVEDQLKDPVLSFIEGLGQGLSLDESDRPLSQQQTWGNGKRTGGGA